MSFTPTGAGHPFVPLIEKLRAAANQNVDLRLSPGQCEMIVNLMTWSRERDTNARKILERNSQTWLGFTLYGFVLGIVLPRLTALLFG